LKEWCGHTITEVRYTEQMAVESHGGSDMMLYDF
jgi:hypothetical protein